jgi:enoyl-CoA hydratase/carnithine racemase
MLTVPDLAEGKGLGLGLDLDRQGRPRRTMILVDLDSAAGVPLDVIEAAARAASHALPLTIGVSAVTPPESLRPLLRALTFSLVAEAGRAHEAGGPPRECVSVPHLGDAVETVRDAATLSPGACVALNRLLRESERLDVRSGLAAEAAVYSMLLSGPEFKRWLAARGPARPADPDERRVRLSSERERLTIVLDRPHRRNAMDARMREALVEALELALLDDSVKRVELAGAGAGFCSGGDLDEFGSAADYVTAYLVRLERHPGWLIHLLRDRLHARLHGACYGAGMEMPLFCHSVSAAPDTLFVLPEVAMGLVPGAGGTVSVPRRAGRWRAAWMAVTGARVDAATALDWGLIDAIDPQ